MDEALLSRIEFRPSMSKATRCVSCGRNETPSDGTAQSLMNRWCIEFVCTAPSLCSHVACTALFLHT